MPILRNSSRDRFTVVINQTIEDSLLSYEALGLYTYLASKPDRWEIRPAQLAKRGGIGRYKLLRIMGELRDAGYLTYDTPRDEKGRLLGKIIVLSESPIGEKTENGETRKSENLNFGKPDPLVNTDSLVNTEEEAKTEERQSQPTAASPSPAKPKSGKITMDTFLQHCREVGEPPILDNGGAVAYAESAGIPKDWVVLAWDEFRDRHKGTQKKYAGPNGWRRAFGNCIRQNWYKLWAINGNGEYFLTQEGKQAQKAHGVEP